VHCACGLMMQWPKCWNCDLEVVVRLLAILLSDIDLGQVVHTRAIILIINHRIIRGTVGHPLEHVHWGKIH